MKVAWGNMQRVRETGASQKRRGGRGASFYNLPQFFHVHAHLLSQMKRRASGQAKMKDGYTPTNSHYINYTVHIFSLEGWENVHFELGSERVRNLVWIEGAS